jgi:GNAT superfamily N-acetyltransferase
MGLTYFKRYRMEIELAGRDLSEPALPEGYELLPWDPALLEAHAEAKYESFRTEIDANVFPCLGDSDGCHRLMAEIAGKDGFLPHATWLLTWREGPGEPVEYCGTIQGVRDRHDCGAVQNLGITPRHRGQGLGTMLLTQSMAGFHRGGLARVCLEVTSQNDGAIRLYQRIGFRTVRTVYKAVDVVCAASR